MNNKKNVKIKKTKSYYIIWYITYSIIAIGIFINTFFL